VRTVKRVMANRIGLHNVFEFRAEKGGFDDESRQKQSDLCLLATLSR